MFQLGVCKRYERFTWDKFKNSEEDHKNMQRLSQIDAQVFKDIC